MFIAKQRIIHALAILAAVFLIVPLGCDRAARHKVLTFFFEGVPPLQTDAPAVDSRTSEEESSALAAANQKMPTIDRQRAASRHKPSQDCYQCHLQQGGWNQERLAEPVPELCYSCHANFNVAEGYLHGPIAAGECLFCHDPHQSKYVHLQKYPQPALCYQCHLAGDIEATDYHRHLSARLCTDCHDPHAASTGNLLRSDLQTKESSDNSK